MQPVNQNKIRKHKIKSGDSIISIISHALGKENLYDKYYEKINKYIDELIRSNDKIFIETGTELRRQIQLTQSSVIGLS